MTKTSATTLPSFLTKSSHFKAQPMLSLPLQDNSPHPCCLHPTPHAELPARFLPLTLTTAVSGPNLSTLYKKSNLLEIS